MRKSKNNPYRKLILFFLLMTGFGCSTIMSYESMIRKADSIDLKKEIDKNDAILIAQKHIILTGLDQDISVRRIGEVKLMDDQNFWLVTFNKTIDNKVGERRDEIPREIIIKVNRATGTSFLFSK